MKNAWTYKNHEIEEGLKPGSKTFRYFLRFWKVVRKNVIIVSGLLMTPLADSIRPRNSMVLLLQTKLSGNSG